MEEYKAMSTTAVNLILLSQLPVKSFIESMGLWVTIAFRVEDQIHSQMERRNVGILQFDISHQFYDHDTMRGEQPGRAKFQILDLIRVSRFVRINGLVFISVLAPIIVDRDERARSA